MPSSGNKAELIKRLLTVVHDAHKAPDETQFFDANTTKGPDDCPPRENSTPQNIHAIGNRQYTPVENANQQQNKGFAEMNAEIESLKAQLANAQCARTDNYPVHQMAPPASEYHGHMGQYPHYIPPREPPVVSGFPQTYYRMDPNPAQQNFQPSANHNKAHQQFQPYVMYPNQAQPQFSHSNLMQQQYQPYPQPIPAQQQYQPHPQNFLHTTVQQAADVLPEFIPGNESYGSARNFIARVRALQAYHGWDDRLILFAAQQKLRGSAKRWNDASLELFQTFDAFTQKLLQTFPDVISEADVHEELVRATRGSGESLQDFCHRMSSIGNKTNMAERTLVHHILKRMNHHDFSLAVVNQDIGTLTELHTAIARFRRAFPEKRTPQATSVSQSVSQAPIKKPPQAVDKTEAANTTSNGDKCFKCKEKGHRANECTKPRPRCENCKRIGHEASACRSQTPAEDTVRKIAEPKRNALSKPAIVGGHELQAFIDGGSFRSLIGKTLANKISEVIPCTPFQIRGFSAEPIWCSSMIKVDVMVDGQTYHNGELHLVDDQHLAPGEVILGTKLLCGEGQRLVIGGDECFILPQVDGKAKLTKLLEDFKPCFSKDLSEIGTCKIGELKIELTTDKPVNVRPYKVPFAKQQVVKSMVDELLENGIISKSNSPYASAIVMVKKPTGEDRMCVDYRPLNAITMKQPFPMPTVEDLLGQLAGYTYFTTLDLMSGYYQIPIHTDSQKYTAFVTQNGHYEFLRMPFGLVNAPSVFQSIMNEITKRLPSGEIVTYLDDTIIPSMTIEEGLARLGRFLAVIKEVGLTLRLEKCHFLQTRTRFLGHNIEKNIVQPGDTKIKAIQDFKPPSDVHEVRRFLGLTGFFRKFVKNYSAIAKPLTMLLKTKENPRFEWGESQLTAFDDLKHRLCSEPVLAMYDVRCRHEVHTDASCVGLAGVLMQENVDDKLLHPVMYFSRHCTPAESKYASHELEVLAIVESLERFRMYVMGKPIRVVTDCAAVATTKLSKELVPRIARWWLKVQEYDIELVHRPGVQLAYVDAMSRAPCESSREVPVVTERTMRIEVDRDDWLLTMQLQDPKLQRIIRVLNGSEKADDSKQISSMFELQNGRLYRKVNDSNRWVVPNAVRWRIVKNAHDDRGHFGIDKTLQNINNDFWFRHMRPYVKSYIDACIECAYNKRPSGPTEGRLHISETVPVPFRTVHVDHLGPFTKSSRGNVYLLVVSDSFSKYVVLKAVKTTQSKSVILLFNELTAYFGLPSQIVSDRGTAFTSKLFEGYCDRNNIVHIKNAVRTPRANGQVERVNQVVGRFLRTVTADPRKWDNDLQDLQWIINSQVNKTNNCCPNDVVFRYKLRDRLQNKVLSVLQETGENEKSTPDSEATLEDIAARADTEKAKWKIRFDSAHRQPRTYSEGDLVLVENIAPATGDSRKLEPKFRGPYAIQKVLDKDRYVVADIDGAPRTQRPFQSIFTTEKLKPWCTLGPEAAEDGIEDEASDEELIDEDNQNDSFPKSGQEPRRLQAGGAELSGEN